MKFIFAFPGQETLSEPAPCRGPSGNSEPGPRGGCRGVPRQQTGSPKPYFRAARCWTAVRREHGGRGQMNTTALARHVGLVTRSGRSGSESLLPLNGGGWSPLPAAWVLVVRATCLALATAPATALCPTCVLSLTRTTQHFSHQRRCRPHPSALLGPSPTSGLPWSPGQDGFVPAARGQRGGPLGLPEDPKRRQEQGVCSQSLRTPWPAGRPLDAPPRAPPHVDRGPPRSASALLGT